MTPNGFFTERTAFRDSRTYRVVRVVHCMIVHECVWAFCPRSKVYMSDVDMCFFLQTVYQ
jgi:hypothetical protein